MEIAGVSLARNLDRYLERNLGFLSQGRPHFSNATLAYKAGASRAERDPLKKAPKGGSTTQTVRAP